MALSKWIDKSKLKSEVDLQSYVDFIGKHKGGCPSCHGKRSFVIYHDGFYCHKCGYSGDQIQYVIDRHKCSFARALEILRDWMD